MATKPGNDKMSKNIRENLRRVSNTSGKYFQGSAKLFLASTKDLAKASMPTLGGMMETNKDLITDMSRFLRNPSDAIHRATDTAMQSDSYKAIKQVAEYALEDLKSGEFYDPERDRTQFGQDTAGLLDTFGDFDMSGFDSEGNYDDDDLFSDIDLKHEEALQESHEKASDARTQATIDTIQAVGNAAVATSRANAQTDIRLGIKQHAQIMSSMENIVTQQGAILQAVNQTASSLLDVTREAHQEVMGSLTNITDLLMQIEANTHNTGSESEVADESNDDLFGVHGEIDIRKWLKRSAKNTMDKYQISNMLGFAGGFDVQTLAESVMSNPLQMVSDFMVKKMLPDYLNKTIETTKSYMESFFPTLLAKFAEKGRKFDMDIESGKGGNYKDFLLGMLGVQEKKGGYIDLTPQDVTQAAGLSKKTIQTIEEVIPMWLSKIYSAVSGDELSMYNHVTGKMENVYQKIADTQYDVSNLVARMGEASRDFTDRATNNKHMKWEDERMKKEFEDYAFKFLQRAADNGSFLNPWKEDDLFDKDLPDGPNKDLYGKIIKSVMLHMPRKQLMGLNSEIASARRNQRQANRQTEKDLRDSGMDILFQMVPEDLRYQLESATMEHRWGLNENQRKKVVSGYNKSVRDSGEKIGIMATNEYLADITSMLKRGIVVFPGGSMGDAAPDPYIGKGKQRRENPAYADYLFRLQTRNTAFRDSAAEADRLIYLNRNRNAAAMNEEVEIREKNEKSKRDQQSGRGARGENIWVNADTDMTSLNLAQGQYSIDKTRSHRSDSVMVEEQRYAQMTEKEKKEYREQQQIAKRNNMIKEHLAQKATSYKDALGIGMPLSSGQKEKADKGLYARFKEVKDTPFKMLDLGLRTVDQFMFKILYGEDAANIPAGEDGDPDATSLMRVITTSVQAQWKNATEWFRTNIGEPMKEFFFGEEGVFTRIGARGKELFNQYIMPQVDKIKGRLTGVKGEDGLWTGGIFSSTMNRAHEMKGGLLDVASEKFGQLKNRYLYGSDDANSEGVLNKGRISRTVEDRRNLIRSKMDKKTGKMMYTYKNADGSMETTDQMRTMIKNEYYGLMGQVKKGFDDFKEMMFGPDENGDDHGSKDKFKLVTGELKKAYPDMTIGAGIGVIGSLFLPGGPILGAIIGSTAGLVGSSEKFREFLFGKTKKKTKQKYNMKTGTMEEVEYDSYDDTGIFSSQIIDGVKQYFPKMATGAFVGKIIGGGLMPGIMGQAIGTVAGSVVGMVASSDKLKQIIFGDIANGEDDGIISKKMRDGIARMFTEHAPGVIAGGLTGAKVGSFIGAGIGLIPGLTLAGPIATIMGTMVGAIGGDTLQEFFFGRTQEVEEPDPNNPGKTIKVKKKVGGMFGKAFDYARDNMLKPFGEKVNQLGETVSSWFDESVVGPLKRSMKPVHEAMEGAKNAIKNTFLNIGQNIKDSLDRTFENAFGSSLHDFFEERVMGPLKKMTNSIFSGIGKAIGAVLSAPFKAVEFIFTGKIGGEVPNEESFGGKKSKDKKGKAPSIKDKKAGLLANMAGDKDRNAGMFSKFRQSMAEAREARENRPSMMDSLRAWQNEKKTLAASRKAQRDSDRELAAKEKAARAAEASENKEPGILDRIAERRRIAEERAKEKKEARAAEKAQKAEEKAKMQEERAALKAKGKPKAEQTVLAAQAQAPQVVGTATNAATNVTPPSINGGNPPPAPGAPKVPSSGQHNAEGAQPPKINQPAQTNAAQNQDVQQAQTQGKSTHEYVRSIDRTLTGIYDEIRGQLGNTGWNLGYIKVLLEKKMGKLKSDELPEEMEGSTRKSVTKRKGIFGKIGTGIGRIGAGTIGLLGRGVGGLFDGIGSLFEGAASILLSPIKILGGALTGLGNAVGTIANSLFKTAASLVEMITKGVTSILSGATQVIANTLVGATKIITAAATGIGTALGNIVGTLTGVLKDLTLAVTGVVSGLVRTIGAIVPEVVGPIVKGMATVGKTIAKGIWGGVKTVGKGIGWLLDNTVGRLFGGGGRGNTYKFKGDTLVPVAVGGVEAKIPYPYVTVSGGKLDFASSNHAIPVYLVGADKAATVYTRHAKKDRGERNDPLEEIYELASSAGSIYVHDQGVHNKLNRLMEHFRVDTTGTGPHDNIDSILPKRHDDVIEEIGTTVGETVSSSLDEALAAQQSPLDTVIDMNQPLTAEAALGGEGGLTFAFTENDALVVHIDSLSDKAQDQMSGKNTKMGIRDPITFAKDWFTRNRFEGEYYRGFTLNPIEMTKRHFNPGLKPQVVDIPRMHFKDKAMMVYVNGMNPATLKYLTGREGDFDNKEAYKSPWKRKNERADEKEYDASGREIEKLHKGWFNGKGPIASRKNAKIEAARAEVYTKPSQIQLAGVKTRGGALAVYMADMDPRLIYMIRGQMKPVHLLSDKGSSGATVPVGAEAAPANKKKGEEGGKKKRRSFREWFKDTKNSILDKMGFAGTALRFMGGVLGGFKDPIKNQFKGVWDNGFGLVGRGIKSIGKDIAETETVQNAKNRVTGAYQNFTGGADNAKDALRNAASNTGRAISDAASTAKYNAGIFKQRAGNAIQDAAVEAQIRAGIIQEGAKKKFGEAKDAAKAGAAAAAERAKQLPQDARDAAYRAGQRIDKGVRGVRDDLIEAQIRAGAAAGIIKGKLGDIQPGKLKDAEESLTPSLTLSPDADGAVDYNAYILRNIEKATGAGGTVGQQLVNRNRLDRATGAVKGARDAVAGKVQAGVKGAKIAYTGHKLNSLMDEIQAHEIGAKEDAMNSVLDDLNAHLAADREAATKTTTQTVQDEVLAGATSGASLGEKASGIFDKVRKGFTKDNVKKGVKKAGRMAQEQIEKISPDDIRRAKDLGIDIIASNYHMDLPHNMKEARSWLDGIKDFITSYSDEALAQKAAEEAAANADQTTNKAGEEVGDATLEPITPDTTVVDTLSAGISVTVIGMSNEFSAMLTSSIAAALGRGGIADTGVDAEDAVDTSAGTKSRRGGKKRGSRSGSGNAKKNNAAITAAGVAAGVVKNAKDAAAAAKSAEDDTKRADKRAVDEFKAGYGNVERREDQDGQEAAVTKAVENADSMEEIEGATKAAETNPGTGGGGGSGEAAPKEKTNTGLLDTIGSLGSGLMNMLGNSGGLSLGGIASAVVPFLMGNLANQKGLLGAVARLPVIGDFVREAGYDVSSQIANGANQITEANGRGDLVKRNSILASLRSWRNSFNFAKDIEEVGMAKAIGKNKKTGTFSQKAKGSLIAGFDNIKKAVGAGLDADYGTKLITNNADDAVETLAGNKSKFLTKIANGAKALKAGFTGQQIGANADDLAKTMANKAVGGSKSQAMLGRVGAMIGKGKDVATDLAEKASGHVDDLVSSVKGSKIGTAIGDGITTASKNITRITTAAASGAVDDVADMGKIAQAITKMLDKVMNNKTLVKFAGGLKNKLGPAVSKIMEFIKSKVLPKAAKQMTGKSFASIGSTILNVVSGGLFQAAMAVKDFISGYYDANKYFNAYSKDLSLAMKLTSGIVNMLGGLLGSILSPVGPILSAVFSVVQEPLIQILYNLFATDEQKAELKANQEKAQADVDAYNAEHGTDMTLDEYTTDFNEDGSMRLGAKIGKMLGFKSAAEKRKEKKEKEEAKANGEEKKSIFAKIGDFFSRKKDDESSEESSGDSTVVINVNSAGASDVNVASDNAETSTETGKGKGLPDMSYANQAQQQFQQMQPQANPVEPAVDLNAGQFGTGMHVAVMAGASKAASAIANAAGAAAPMAKALGPTAVSMYANSFVNQNEGWTENIKLRNKVNMIGSTINNVVGENIIGGTKDLSGNTMFGQIGGRIFKGAKTVLSGGTLEGGSGIMGAIDKVLNKLLGNKMVQKLFGKLAPKISNLVTTVSGFIKTKVLPKVAAENGEALMKNIGKNAFKHIGGLLNIAFAVKDFITGFRTASKYFPDAPELTLGMKLTSAFVNCLGGLLSLIPVVGPLISAGASMFMDDLVPLVYNALTGNGNSDEPDEESMGNIAGPADSVSGLIGNMAGSTKRPGTFGTTTTTGFGSYKSPVETGQGPGLPDSTVMPQPPMQEGMFGTGAETITGIAGTAGNSSDAAKEMLEKLTTVGTGIGKAIINTSLLGIPGGVKNFATIFSKIGAGMGGTMIDDLKDGDDEATMGTVVTDSIKQIMSKIFLGDEDPDAAKTKSNGFFSTIKNGIGNVFTNIKDKLSNGLQNAVSVISNVGGTIQDMWNNFWNGGEKPEDTADQSGGVTITELEPTGASIPQIDDKAEALANAGYISPSTAAYVGRKIGADMSAVQAAQQSAETTVGDSTFVPVTEFNQGQYNSCKSTMKNWLTEFADDATMVSRINGISDQFDQSKQDEAAKISYINSVRRLQQDYIEPARAAAKEAGKGRWGTGKVKPMDQTAGKWNKNSNLMSKVGCGPTVAAMVGSAYGDKTNPAQADAMSKAAGMRASDGGTNPDFFSQYASGKNYGMAKGAADPNKIAANLGKGQPVVMMGKGGAYGNNMHYMVADKMNGKGNVSVVDPVGGTRKNVGLGELTSNASQAVYSYGKGRWGTGAVDMAAEHEQLVKEENAKKNREVQQALVDKMASIKESLQYSLDGPQDPDQGSASCASTVAWAYNKVLGFKPGGSGFASSSYQSRDPNFTTIYQKNSPDSKLPLNIMQPGDIIYYKWGSVNKTFSDLERANPDRPLGHTEMYAGNGHVWNHGSGIGPKYKEIQGGNGKYDRYRNSFLVRRYTPFVDGSTVKAVDGAYNNTPVGGYTGGGTSDYSGGTADDSGEGGSFFGFSNLVDKFGIFGKLASMFTGVGNKLSNIISGLLGDGVSSEELNDSEDGTSSDAGNYNSGSSTPVTFTPVEGGAVEDDGEYTTTVWNYLRKQGLSKEAVAGIMGNLEAESGISPSNVQNGTYAKGMSKTAEDEKYIKDVTAGTHDFVNDSKGFGLAQWTYYTRKQALYDYLKSRDMKIDNGDGQLGYLFQELGDYKLLGRLNQSGSVKEASNIILHDFEAPADQSGSVENKRASYGQKWYDKYANNEVPSATAQENIDMAASQSNIPGMDGYGPGLDEGETFDNASWGKGPVTPQGISHNVSALNDTVQQINKLMAENKDLAQEESTVEAVTSKITEAITGTQGGTTDKTLAAVAESLGQVVELLTQIAKNTAKSEETENSGRTSARGPRFPGVPKGEYVAQNGRTDPDNVGMDIIDKLTANIR